MPAGTFFTYNILGGLAWVFSLSLGAYYLGSAVHNIERGAIFLFGGAFLLAMIPVSWELYRKWRKKQGKSVVGEKQLDRLKVYLIGDEEDSDGDKRDRQLEEPGETATPHPNEDPAGRQA
jgi:hypothetical protein